MLKCLIHVLCEYFHCLSFCHCKYTLRKRNNFVFSLLNVSGLASELKRGHNFNKTTNLSLLEEHITINKYSKTYEILRYAISDMCN